MLILIYRNYMLIEKYWGRKVINGCAQPGRRAIELTVSHEEINGINWFLVC